MLLTGALLVKLAIEQLSAAVGAVNVIVAVHPDPAVAVIATGVVIVGTVVSTTVTNCVAVAVLPLESVTVHVTVVFPNGKVPGALFVTEATAQLSAVNGDPKTTFVAIQPLLVETLTAEGAVIVGLVASVTVTVCVLVELFP